MAKPRIDISRIPPAEQPTFENVIITPEVARDLLEQTHSNFRPLIPSRVKAYADDLKTDSWHQTADTIKFDVEGNLIDGQHRLQAVVASGVSMEAVVARNVPLGAFRAIDTGCPRNVGQLFHFLGVSHANEVVAALRWVWVYNRYIDGAVNRPLSRGGGRITTAMFESLLAEHPGMTDSVKTVHQIKSKRTVPSSIAAFIHYMGSRTSAEKADLFIERVCSEAELQRGDPVHTLLARIRDHRASRRTVDRDAMCWMTVTAWKAFEDSLTRVRLAWRPEAVFPRFRCDEVNAKAKAA